MNGSISRLVKPIKFFSQQHLVNIPVQLLYHVFELRSIQTLDTVAYIRINHFAGTFITIHIKQS